MSKPARGNLFFLLMFLYAILAPYIFLIIPFFNDFFEVLSIPNQIIFSQLFVFFIPIVFYFVLTGTSLKEAIPLKKVSLKNIVYIVAISFLVQPVMTFLGLIGESFEPNKISDTAFELVNYNYIYGLIAIAVVPSIIEEVIMRGIVLSNYKNTPIFYSAIINGLFFGMLHRNMQQFFYAMLLGFIFSYFVHYTKSLIGVMISHFIINGTQVTYLFLIKIIFETVGMDFMEEVANQDDISLSFGALLIFFSIAIIFGVIVAFLMKKFIKNNKDETELIEVVNCNPFIEKYFLISIVVFLFYTTLSILNIVA